MPLVYISMWLALALACGGAWVKGGRTERLMALALAINLAMGLWPVFLGLFSGQPIEVLGPQATLALDIVLLGALVAIAISSKPLWTLYAAGFQLLATLTSFVRILNVDLTALAYVAVQNTLWWLTMAALGFGIWDASRAKGPAPLTGSLAGDTGERA